MLTLIKNTINSGNFKYMELQQRISRLYAMGNITEAELDELLALAVEKASPDTERPELLTLIKSLSGKVAALTACVEELSARVKALEHGDNADLTEDTADEYPAWEPWDGLSDQYQPGAMVFHVGQLWKSTFPGQNVWEPGVVDDRFWLKCSPSELGGLK